MAKESKEITIGVRLSGLSAPSNAPFPNGSSSLAVGNQIASGFANASGIVKDMHEYGDKVLITLENGRQLVMFSSGMLAEIAEEPKAKEAPKP